MRQQYVSRTITIKGNKVTYFMTVKQFKNYACKEKENNNGKSKNL